MSTSTMTGMRDNTSTINISSTKINSIEMYVNKNMAVSYNSLKKRFKLNKEEFNKIISKLKESKRVSLMKNRIVWSYCHPELKKSLLRRK